MVRVFTVYHSQFGHTELQAKAVHDGVLSHTKDAVLITAAEAIERLDELDSADAIIFGCPTYMGSMSADMKKFVEVAAKKWFSLAWKDKVAGAFTNSTNFSGDKLNTLVGLFINALQHGMIFVGLGMLPPVSKETPEEGPGIESLNRVGSSIGPMASSFSRPSPPEGDLKTAYAYGQRVAEIASRLKKGRS